MNKLFGHESSQNGGGIKKRWIGGREWVVRACSKVEWKIQVTNVCLQGAAEGKRDWESLELLLQSLQESEWDIGKNKAQPGK